MKQKEMNISDVSESKPSMSKQVEISNGNTPPKHLSDIVGTTNETKGKKKSSIFKKKDSKAAKTKKELKKGQKVAIGVITLLALLSVPTYLVVSSFSVAPQMPTKIISINSGSLTSNPVPTASYYMPVVLPEPTEPKTHESPVNGVLLTETEYRGLMDRLPIAVMVNNHALARPQSNLSRADIVFETIAESGITRYMAVYWSNKVNKVGPIRSARQYHIEWLSPFDAIYLHDGYASSDDLRVDAGGNLYRYGIKTLSTYGAWREYDGVRKAPHNEYTSPAKAWIRAETLNYGGLPEEFESWKFKRDAISAERGEVIGADIVFWERIWNGGAYDVHWAYDNSTNSYFRSVGGRPDIDQEYDKQIAAKVVVLQSVDMVSTYDDKAHVIITTIGQGDTTILQDGKAIEGTWKKNSRTTRTHYYDKEGNEIELNRGLVWVEAIPKTQGSFAIINK